VGRNTIRGAERDCSKNSNTLALSEECRNEIHARPGHLVGKSRQSKDPSVSRSDARSPPVNLVDAIFWHGRSQPAAVVGRALPNNEQEVAAYVIVKAEVTTGQLLAHCRQRLTPYKVPRQIHIVSDLPRNSSGKVDKRVLASWSGAPTRANA
jgi:acyl-coenzyme A synthetase/AMP-(fatty) acid ligase